MTGPQPSRMQALETSRVRQIAIHAPEARAIAAAKLPVRRMGSHRSVPRAIGMKRRNRALAALAIATLIVGGSCYYFSQEALPNFETVRSGVLYRSGQPRGVGLEFVRLFGIRTLVNLRSPGSDGTREEESFAAEKGLDFHNLTMGPSRQELETTVERFLDVVGNESNWPVLLHCSRGYERSGVLSAIYRIENDGWSNQEALEEAHRLGLDKGEMPIAEEFVRTYRPRWADDGDTAAGTP